MEISADKKTIIKSVLKWLKKPERQYITIGGYAGTGKTLLINLLTAEIRKSKKELKIAFCSYTGKAAQVLSAYLKASKDTLKKKDSISTIHGLIYEPLLNSQQEIIGWERKDSIKADLIIIDEASMVDEAIWNDLIGYKKLIIAVGDHGQLPPVNGSFNLMTKPDFTLETIHRQQKENPIIELSIMARLTGTIPPGNYSDKVRKFEKEDSDTQESMQELLSSYDPDTLILCGYNKTRIRLNEFIRKAIGFETPQPAVHDRVICLRNNHKKQIFNGMIGTIKSLIDHDEDWYQAEIVFDNGQLFEGLILKAQFGAESGLNFTNKRSKTSAGDLFDWGYALTVHKAQGSQAQRVILFEERFSRMSESDWRRWLYTAVTRAQEEVYIF